jgi:2-polyprenyl-3-methyl-5-hydroxy-6-metoxy-1,4-benzoquinol methylase
MNELNSNKGKTLKRYCPICGNRKGELLFRQEFCLPEEYGLPAAYDIVSCQKCGFTFADTAVDQEAYDRYYTVCSKYEDEKVATGAGAQDWDAERLEQAADAIASFLPDKASSILDIGCAGGGLLKVLKARGNNNVVGLDPSAVCVRQTKDMGVEAYSGSIFSSRSEIEIEPGRQFDMVILSHVLEHILNVDKAVENVMTWLAPDGLLYIETPDAAHYQDHFKVPFYYFDIEHINHFDLASLRNLSARHGLAFVSGSTRNVSIEEGNEYPVVFGVLKKIQEPVNEDTVLDKTARDSVSWYIDMSKSRDKWPELEELVESQDAIIVWGAGSYTQRLLKTTPLGGCNILAFVDNDKQKQGTKLNGIDIKPPLFVKECDATIIVCAALQSDAILLEIEELDAAERAVVLKGSE